ncbi:MAG: hypothetical protein Q8Q09_26985 [Deltaproteobacteria bacterium]|nr:hypothetical protein [Deltaproteobacteria bacterium]
MRSLSLRPFGASLVAVAFLSLAPDARAQTRPTGENLALSQREAQRLFRQATEAFDQQHFAAATALFRAAYETDRSTPAYLFNAARSSEQAGDFTTAAQLYEWLLRELPADDIPARTAAQNALESVRRSHPQVTAPALPPQPPPAPSGPLMQEPRTTTARPSLVGPLAVMSVGALVAASAGIFFGLRESNLATAQSACGPVDPSSNTIDCSSATPRQQQRAIDAHAGATTFNTLIPVSLAVGGAALVTGAVWLIAAQTWRPRPETLATHRGPRTIAVGLGSVTLAGVW